MNVELSSDRCNEPSLWGGGKRRRRKHYEWRTDITSQTHSWMECDVSHYTHMRFLAEVRANHPCTSIQSSFPCTPKPPSTNYGTTPNPAKLSIPPPPQKQYPLSKTENVLFPGGFRSGTQFPTAKLQNFSSNLFFLLSWLALALPELAVRANWCKMSRVMNLQGGGRGGVGEGDWSTHSMVGPGKRKPCRRKEGIC